MNQSPSLAITLVIAFLLGGILASCTSTQDLPSLPGLSSTDKKPEPVAEPAIRIPGMPVADIQGEPTIRVRIQTGIDELKFRADGLLTVTVLNAPSSSTLQLPAPVTFIRNGKGFVCRSGDGRVYQWDVDALAVEPVNAAFVTLPFRETTAQYPGRVALHRKADSSTLFDAVNHVKLEAYLPGVLERELYPNFHIEAYKAQAVAARSYAFFEMYHARQGNRYYDIESTTASQVYGGKSRRPKAIEAVNATRGEVLVWEGHVLPAFYSASHGGRTQDAADAFENFPDIPPLRGQNVGDWDKEDAEYRWGPAVRNRATFAKRLAAWGNRRNHPIAQIKDIAQISITERSRAGRPKIFTFTETAGKTYQLKSEKFRVAANQSYPGAPRLTRETRVYSSDVEPTVQDNRIILNNGRGHGHGVGMSQWGAEGMARSGKSSTSILRQYYLGVIQNRIY